MFLSGDEIRLGCMPIVSTNVFNLKAQFNIRLKGIYLQDIIDSCQNLDRERLFWRDGQYSGDTTDCKRARELFDRHGLSVVDRDGRLHIYVLCTVTSDGHSPYR